MAPLPLPRYAPDLARYNAQALSRVNNVVPSADGWKPLKSIVATPTVYDYLTDEFGNRLTDESGNLLIIGTDWSGISGLLQLPGDCTGLFAARKKDGTELLFAGTYDKLFVFNRVQFVWDDVSSTAYASVCRWSIVQFGSYVIAQNGFNNEQIIDIETDIFFSDNVGAPVCKYLAVVKNFVFRGNIVDWPSQGITNQPAMIQCSAIEDPTDNEPQNFNFSDYQTLPTGDEIMGIVPVSGGCHIWMKNALYGLTLTIADYTFTTEPIDEMRGTSAPYALGIIGQNDYIVYCDDGLWRFSGGFQPIGDGVVNLTFLADCDQNEREDILACVDPENLIVWLAYTDNDAQRKMLGYHYVLNAFTMSDTAVQASVRARTFIYGSSIDTENLLRFATIDQNRTLGYQVGDPKEASFGSNEILLNGVNRSFVNGLRLITDATEYYSTVSTRDILGGLPRSRPSAAPSARTGFVPTRADGRSHQFDFVIPEGTTWTVATAVDVDAKGSGR